MTENNEKTFNAIVDRIEGNYAVCEMSCDTMIDIDLSTIPFEIKENDHLCIEFDEFGNVTVVKLPKKNFLKRVLKPKFIRFT